MSPNRSLKPFIGAFLVLACGVGAIVYWFVPEEAGKAPNIVSTSRFDHLFSKEHKLVTSLADVPDLRDVSLEGEDIELRIWHGHSISNPEGVFLKRANGRWSGRYIGVKSDRNGEVQGAEVEQLENPKQGGESFWSELVDKGILKFPLTPENGCESKYRDGVIYVVEISQNGTYRNYQYLAGADGCRESKQMTEIGKIIGLEFDSGPQQCRTGYEWFACAKKRR